MEKIASYRVLVSHVLHDRRSGPESSRSDSPAFLLLQQRNADDHPAHVPAVYSDILRSLMAGLKASAPPSLRHLHVSETR